MKTRITAKTKAVTLFFAFSPSLDMVFDKKIIELLFYFDVWKEDDLQRLRSMMMYITMMKNVGMANEVTKKLMWNPAKL